MTVAPGEGRSTSRAPATALVTGAAGGIGGAVSAALARDGTRVVGHDRSPAQGPFAAVLTGDLLDGDPRTVVAAAEEAVGPLDALVHCAGGGDGAPLLEMSDADWRAVLELNLGVAFPLCQAAARTMVERGGGAIVLIGSLCGRQAWRDYGHYCAAKAGLEMLGRSLAVELADVGVRCNTVVPGAIDTPLNDAVLEADSGELPRLLARTPAGRLGSASEVAEVAAWLARAPAFVNGASIVVDGGYGIEATP